MSVFVSGENCQTDPSFKAQATRPINSQIPVGTPGHTNLPQQKSSKLAGGVPTIGNKTGKA